MAASPRSRTRWAARDAGGVVGEHVRALAGSPVGWLPVTWWLAGCWLVAGRAGPGRAGPGWWQASWLASWPAGRRGGWLAARWAGVETCDVGEGRGGPYGGNGGAEVGLNEEAGVRAK